MPSTLDLTKTRGALWTGLYQATPVTLSDGDPCPVLLDSTGHPIVASSQSTVTAITAATAISTTGSPLNSAAFTNLFNGGLFLNITVGSVANSPSITVQIQGQDSISTNWFNLAGLVTAAITSNSSVGLMFYPGITVAGNTQLNGKLPLIWRVQVVTTGVGATATIGVSGHYLV